MKVDKKSALIGRVALAAAVTGAIFSYAPASSANPGSAHQQMACMGDVMRLCFTSIGNDQAIVGCMTRNKDRLSQRCKATLPPI